jgi:hypothetical protein
MFILIVVRTESLYNSRLFSSLGAPVSNREGAVRSQGSPCEMLGRKSGTDSSFEYFGLQLSIAFHKCSSVRIFITKRTNGRRLGTLKKVMLLRKLGSNGVKRTSTFYLQLLKPHQKFLLWFIYQQYFLTHLTAQEVMRSSEA